MALQMWELLDFSEIDHSVLSKVIHGERLFTFKQLSVFCKIMKLSQVQRNILFEALINDKMANDGIDSGKNRLLYAAKLNWQTNINKNNSKQQITKLNNRSRNLLRTTLSKIVPKTNELSRIGIVFADSSYYHLVNKGIQKCKLKIEHLFAGFDVSIPYCSFKKTIEGLENNCKCGYHLSLYGVIKECLLNKIFSKNDIQAEIKKWKTFFFPKESAIDYLEDFVPKNKDINALLHNLKQNRVESY